MANAMDTAPWPGLWRAMLYGCVHMPVRNLGGRLETLWMINSV